VGHVPLPGENLGERLVLFFNEPLAWAPEDENAQPLLIEPPIKGAFDVTDNYIAYTVEEDLSGKSLVLRVSLNPALRGESGATPCDGQGLSLSTFALQVRRAWRLSDDGPDGAARIALLFSAPPDLAVLQAKIRVEDAGGHAVAAAVSAGESPEEIVVTPAAEAAKPLFIIVPRGVPDATGSVTTLERQRYRYPSPDPLAVRGLTWSSNPPEEPIAHIDFSDVVAPAALRRHLEVTGADTGEALAFAIDRIANNTQRLAITLTEAPPSGTRVRFALREGMPGQGLTLLPKAWEETLLYSTRQVMIDRGWWREEGIQGAALSLYTSHGLLLEHVREHLTVSPEVPNFRVEAGEYDENFLVMGDWVAGARYELTLAPGIADTSGRFTRVEPQVWRTEEVPEIRGVAFAYPGKFYFPRNQGDALILQTRNYEAVNVKVSRLFPSNIAVMLESLEGGEGNWQFDNRWSEEVATQKVETPGPAGQVVETRVGLQGLFGDTWKGVFRLSTEEWGQGQIVVWTNLGLLVHWEEDAAVVFVHDLVTLEPAAHAMVTLYSSKNQPMGTIHTDQEGIAHFPALRTALGRPQVVVAELGDDYTFLELERREDDVEAFAQTMPRFGETQYDAFIYGDRDIYRPGETVHLRWLVRTPEGDAAGSVPLKLTITRPTGSTLLEETVTLSDLGTGERDIVSERIWPTGEYSVSLAVPGASALVGQYTFSLEEFVPNRIEAAVGVPEGPWMPGQAYPVTVRADHLFGAPASGRRAEAEVVLQKADLQLPGWEGYQFSNDADFEPYRTAIDEQETGEDGSAAFSYTYTPEPEETFPLRAIVRGRVFELGGRAVTASTETTIVPAETLLGLAVSGGATAGALIANVAAVTPTGAPAALATATVTLERETWRYNVRRYRGYYEPDWTREFVKLDEKEVALTEGRGEAEFVVPGNYGYYRVRVSSPETPQFATRKFYTWWGGRLEMADQARPSLLKLTAEKQGYEVGEEVVVRLEAPFDGRAFVTIQGDGFKHSTATVLENSAGEVRFTVGDQHVPNVYVHATVVHRMQEDTGNLYPRSTFAMINVPVKAPRRAVQVTFPDLPGEMRPAQAWQLPVETRDHTGSPIAAEVTLAVVDEGILALTHYATPDPYTWLMRPRRPDYQRAHYYDKVAYDFGKTPIGGDGLGARLGEDAPFVGDNWIKPLALWSGVVRTGDDGRATADFELPEFNGKVRVVAVACTKQALGSAGANVFIRRPYMLRTSLPRFLNVGDTFSASAVVFNTQETEVEATLTWKAEGALHAAEGSRTLTVPAKGEARMTVDLGAGDAIGQGNLTWTLDAGGESYTEEAPIPVRPSVFFETHHETVVLEPGESRTIENTRFLEGANMETGITATVNPLLPLAPALEDLIAYPYGCLEQTVSRCFPLYLLRGQSNLLGAAAGLDERVIDSYVTAGVERLLSMQVASGGLAFWPGGNTAYPYGSVYACHFLTLLKRDHSYAVPETALATLQGYVRRIANDWDTKLEDYQEWHEHSRLFLRAYAHYVLALDGDLEAIRQISRFDSVPLPTAARYLLASALLMNTDDRNRVAMYLSEAPHFEYGVTEQDATLNSGARNDGIQLMTLAQMGLEPETQAALAAKLVRALENRHGLNTQEMAFVVTALGEYLRSLEIDTGTAAFTITGPEGEQPHTGTEIYTGNYRGFLAPFIVNNTGGTRLYVNVRTAGTPKEPLRKAVSEGFRVTRTLIPYDGGSAPVSEPAQGASYIVRVKLLADESGKNAVLDVPLAAGFEIENPRLDDELLSGLKLPDQAVPTHFEVRDDRYIAAFDTLGKGDHSVYFVVRAVTPGSFIWPGARAELMYQPAVHGRDAAQDVAVK
jgi:uncharacterized protein YfaS (alpha-2-macroglobulin family)